MHVVFQSPSKPSSEDRCAPAKSGTEHTDRVDLSAGRHASDDARTRGAVTDEILVRTVYIADVILGIGVILHDDRPGQTPYERMICVHAAVDDRHSHAFPVSASPGPLLGGVGEWQRCGRAEGRWIEGVSPGRLHEDVAAKSATTSSSCTANRRWAVSATGEN